MEKNGPATTFSKDEIRRIRELIWKQGKANQKTFPWRQDIGRWHGLAAEVLLQRTRASSVVPVFERFRSRFAEPQDMADASEDDILDVVSSLGLHWRVPLLKKLGEQLSQLDTVPTDPMKLKALPGIGDYSAAAFRTFHANERDVLVDANTTRLCCRLTGTQYDGETRRKPWVRALLDRLTPQQDHRDFNYALLDFCMSVCTPKNPRCEECAVGPGHCRYGAQELQTQE